MCNIRSMTGYGKGEYNDGKRCIVTEIKTVNNRYSDIIIKAPKHLRPFEEKLRKKIKKNVNRGRTEVYITIEYISESETKIIPNIELAGSYFDAVKKIVNSLDIKDECSLDTILKFQDVLTMKRKEENENEIYASLEQSTFNAIDNLVKMRKREGAELEKDILEKTLSIEKYLDEIEISASTLVQDCKERLEIRLNELLNGKYDLDESRLYNEIVFYADKGDINEEIVRLRSHIIQIRKTLSIGGTIGRKLDFIIQESNREINTIGSKVSNLDITKFVIEIKNLLEKIREQVQNIE